MHSMKKYRTRLIQSKNMLIHNEKGLILSEESFFFSALFPMRSMSIYRTRLIQSKNMLIHNEKGLILSEESFFFHAFFPVLFRIYRILSVIFGLLCRMNASFVLKIREQTIF